MSPLKYFSHPTHERNTHSKPSSAEVPQTGNSQEKTKALRSDFGPTSTQGHNILSTNHRTVEIGGWEAGITVPNICCCSPGGLPSRGSHTCHLINSDQLWDPRNGGGSDLCHSRAEALWSSVCLVPISTPQLYPQTCSVQAGTSAQGAWAPGTEGRAHSRHKPLSLKTTEVWGFSITAAWAGLTYFMREGFPEVQPFCF